MLISYKRGQGSIVLRVKILDSAASTGAGKTGLTHSSAGLIISTIADNEATPTVYAQGSSNIETITTLGTFAAPTASKCRFKEVDATNHKGIYEIQIADARYAVSNAKSLLISISGASGAAETDALIPLRAIDPYDAAAGGMTNLDAQVSTRATPAQVNTEADAALADIGATSARMARLDADISSRATPAQVNTECDTALSDAGVNTTRMARMDADISSRAVAGDAMTLTSGERTAVANEVEAQIIDDTDSEKVLQAIVDKIAAANPSLEDLTLAAIASAIRTELATELARIDAAVSTRATPAQVNTEADNALADAGVNTTRMARLDADISSRATPAQVNTEADAALADIGATSARMARLDADVSSRLAASSYTAPDNASAAAAAASSATAATQATSAATNAAAAKAVTDKLNTMLVLDGVVYQFTVNSLENAPAGEGGGGGDCPSAEEIVQALRESGIAITVVNGTHVSADGTKLTLAQGEAYLSELNNAIRLTINDERLPETIEEDDTTVHLAIQPRAGGTVLRVEGEIVSFLDGVAVVEFEITAAQSAALPSGPGSCRFDVEWVIAGEAGHVLNSIIEGICTVRRQAV